MTQTVLCQIVDGLCTLTLNRPTKLNALTLGMFRELAVHLDALPLDDIGCVLLTGAGRSFCAGHDLDALAGDEESGVERYESGVVERLATLPVPLVASVRGHCYTGGLEVVLAADIIVAADTAKFADTHAKWDLIPVWGLTQRLPRRVGMAKAREMIFTSRTYSGVQAETMGLANFCVPEADLDAQTARLCSEIVANSRRSNRVIKSLLETGDGLSLAAGLAAELDGFPGHGPDFEARLAAMR